MVFLLSLLVGVCGVGCVVFREDILSIVYFWSYILREFLFFGGFNSLGFFIGCRSFTWKVAVRLELGDVFGCREFGELVVGKGFFYTWFVLVGFFGY